MKLEQCGKPNASITVTNNSLKKWANHTKMEALDGFFRALGLPAVG